MPVSLCIEAGFSQQVLSLEPTSEARKVRTLGLQMANLRLSVLRILTNLVPPGHFILSCHVNS
jgi:hypothetical protein